MRLSAPQHALLSVCLALLSVAATAAAADGHIILPADIERAEKDIQAHFSRHLLTSQHTNLKHYIKANSEEYRPEHKDWASVISACRAIGRYERRFLSFMLRTTFHDALAVDPNKLHGGADGSVFTGIEMARAENGGFTAGSLRAVLTVASLYGTSIADTLAVCGAVAVEELSGGRVKIIGKDGKHNFVVGRLDSDQPAEQHQLVGPGADVDEFGDFWEAREFSVDEGIVLLGAHALLEELGCSRSSQPGDECDPDREDCADAVRMFKWDVHYYQDTCTPAIQFSEPGKAVRRATRRELMQELHVTKCRFTSAEYQRKRSARIIDEHKQGELMIPPPAVMWEKDGCDQAKDWGVQDNCPHVDEWPYTVNDAHLGLACQGHKQDKKHGPQVQEAMRRYTDQGAWDAAFPDAYIKMVSKYANVKKAADGQLFFIDGRECPGGGYIVCENCAQQAGLKSYSSVDMCKGCQDGGDCHECCRCVTAFPPGIAIQPGPEPVPFIAPHAD